MEKRAVLREVVALWLKAMLRESSMYNYRREEIGTVVAVVRNGLWTVPAFQNPDEEKTKSSVAEASSEDRSLFCTENTSGRN